MDLFLLVFLVFLNGAFAMSEMALAASRKARFYQVMAETGDAGAQAAMVLHDNPTQFYRQFKLASPRSVSSTVSWVSLFLPTIGRMAQSHFENHRQIGRDLPRLPWW